MMEIQKTVLLSLLILAVVRTIESCEYTKFAETHTLCRARMQTTCPVTRTDVSRQDIDLIMQAHNEHRRLVAVGLESRGKGGRQPPAANMMEMTWDRELAEAAQKWAEQCQIKHDCVKCRQVDRFKVGQNIFASFSTAEGSDPEWEVAIKAWYNEVALFSSSHIEPFRFSRPLGHYTQLAWARTDKIGCGYAYYKEGKFNYKLYICNYGPGGNVVNRPMYEKGSPCSACPEGSSCSIQYPGLCAFGSSGGMRPPPILKIPGRLTAPPATTTTTTTRMTTTSPKPSPSSTTQFRAPSVPKRFKKPSRNNWPQIQSIHQEENQNVNEVQNTRRITNRLQQISKTTSKVISSAAPSQPTRKRNRGRIANIPRISSSVNPPFNKQQTSKRQSFIPPTLGVKVLGAEPQFELPESDLEPLPPRPQTIIPPDSSQEESVTEKPTETRSTPRLQPTPLRTTVKTTSGSPIVASNAPPQENVLVSCTFDESICPIRRVGTALWLMKSDPVQGKYYDTVLRQGEGTQIFLFDGQAIETPERSCLSFTYKKFPVVGNGVLPMEYKVYSATGQPTVVATIQQDTTTDWSQETLELPPFYSISVISFRLQLPPGNPSRAYHMSLDDITITAGACPQ